MKGTLAFPPSRLVCFIVLRAVNVAARFAALIPPGRYTSPPSTCNNHRRGHATAGSLKVHFPPTPIEPGTTTMTGDMDEIDRFLAEEIANLDLSKIQKFAVKGGDVLFGRIEELQLSSVAAGEGQEEESSASFGDMLDAGTGSHSLHWIASIIHRERLIADRKSEKRSPESGGGGETDGGGVRRISLDSYTAVTADESMKKRVLDEAFELGISARGDVVVGDWAHGVSEAGGTVQGVPRLLEGRTYDTILADYLVGAIDGFAPYFQDLVFPRLVEHLKPGGRMYVVGLNPIPDRARGDADIFCRITKARDACILLANNRCYREYPIEWILRHLRRAGLEIVDAHRYPIRYDHATMVRQINVGRSKLRHFTSRGMADEMKKVLDRLEKDSFNITRKRPDGRVTMGFDYVVTAVRPNGQEQEKQMGEPKPTGGKTEGKPVQAKNSEKEMSAEKSS